MKRIALLAGILLGSQSFSVVAQNANEENVKFRWAFGALVGNAKAFVPITRDTSLRTGEEMKMLVELRKDCFVYVLHQNSKGEISLLFPYSLKQFSEDYELDKNYYIPLGRAWFKLDANTGRETFHLLATTQRLLDLEVLLGNHQSAEGDRKQKLAADIVSEIRNVKRLYRTFTTLAERPVTIGGNVRGMEEAEQARRPDVSEI
ncbi:MAG: DUF4384 domain-containing protein, partial [Bacteroidota bacterium]